MFLLEFVNKVRSALACEPLQVLEIGDLPALEQAMHCRLDEGGMSFGDPRLAQSVAEQAGLPLGTEPATVVLPPALRGYVRHCMPRAASPVGAR